MYFSFLFICQEKTRGGSDDERKGGKRMKMSEETRCKVRYKRASTDLYRRARSGRVCTEMVIRMEKGKHL